MVIDKNSFSRFLKIVNLKGSSENEHAMGSLKKDGLEILTICPNKIVGLRGFFRQSNDGEKTDIGINNIPLLRTAVNNFGKEFNLTKKDNKLILSDKNLKISCILRNPAYISNKLEHNTFEEIISKLSEHTITLDISQIKKIINYFNTIGSDSLILTNQNNKLEIKSEKCENELVATIDTEVIEKFEIKLPKVFMEILSIIDDDVELRLNNQSPAYIKIDTKEYAFEILIQRRK